MDKIRSLPDIGRICGSLEFSSRFYEYFGVKWPQAATGNNLRKPCFYFFGIFEELLQSFITMMPFSLDLL